MVWKNILFLVTMVWLSASQAGVGDGVVKEHFKDALNHRIEAPAKSRDHQRGVAGGPQEHKRAPAFKGEQKPDYWKMKPEESSYQPERLEP